MYFSPSLHLLFYNSIEFGHRLSHYLITYQTIEYLNRMIIVISLSAFFSTISPPRSTPTLPPSYDLLQYPSPHPLSGIRRCEFPAKWSNIFHLHITSTLWKVSLSPSFSRSPSRLLHFSCPHCSLAILFPPPSFPPRSLLAFFLFCLRSSLDPSLSLTLSRSLLHFHPHSLLYFFHISSLPRSLNSLLSQGP